MRIIAVDPGGTTGLAFWSDDPSWLESLANEPRQRENHLQMLEDIHGLMRVPAPPTIVCETFTVTEQTLKKSRQTTALRIIGALEFLAFQYSESPIVMQTPADAKGFGTDKRLKAAGMWRPGEGHANDASRHLFLYLAKKRLIDVIEVDRATR